MIWCAAVLLLILGPNPKAWPQSASEKRLKALSGLIEMQKLTVGPFDNFQPTIKNDDSGVFFVRKTGLTNQIYFQKLPHTDPKPFVLSNSDSQQPEISPSGENLAYLSFEDRSLGDICITPTTAFKPKCLNMKEGQISSPFWIKNDELGYLVKDVKTGASRIVARDINTGLVTREFGAGSIWSPTVSRGGQFLSYVVSKAGGLRSLVVVDIKNGKSHEVKTRLPGNPGFAAFSADSASLYFSYYFSDTSGDQRIDGNDNSVILKTQVAPILEEKTSEPEQLTSLNNNCNFPRTTGQFLYVSCAFDGSLDIYRLPLSGTIPTHWNKDQFLDAYKTARTYGDRLALLQNIQRKFKLYSEREFLERNMGIHLLAEDYSASGYYAEKLYQTSREDIFLAAQIFSEAWSAVGPNSDRLPSAPLREKLNQLQSKLSEIKNEGWAKSIVTARIRGFLDRRQEGLKILQARPLSAQHPLARYMYFHTLRDLLKSEKAQGTTLRDLYLFSMNSPEFNQESRLYYAFEWLSELQNSYKDIKLRTATLKESLALCKDESSRKLFESELLTYEMVGAPLKEKNATYIKLTKLVSENKDNYFLSRAMYVRNILTLAEAQEFQHLNLVANNWLRYTSFESTEYLQAIYQFKNAVLSRAYDSYSKGDLSVSSSLFYGSLGVIDDLESHYGFIVTKLVEGQRKTLDERYDFMAKDGYAVESLKYVRSVLSLSNLGNNPKENLKILESAIKDLESTKGFENDPSRRLLLGYCYLEKMILNTVGLEIDRDSFEKAHSHLMLATDVGHDNNRILASAYGNLSLLHQKALNHGLAVEYFNKAKNYGFLTTEDEIHWSFGIAKSYFFLAKYDEAFETMKTISKKVTGPEKLYVAERMAFYSFAQEKYVVAAEIYESFLKEMPAGFAGETQVLMSYATSLFHLKQNKKSAELFQKVLVNLEKPDAATNGNIPKNKERIEFIAVGFLSQLDVGHSTDYLARYLELTEKSEKNIDSMGIRKDAWLKYRILALLRKLDINSQTNERAKISNEVSELLKDYIGETGQYLGPTISESLTILFGEGLLSKESLTKETLEKLEDIYAKYSKAASSQPFSPPLAKQKLRLDIYRIKFRGESTSGIMNEEWYKLLKISVPKLAEELDRLL